MKTRRYWLRSIIKTQKEHIEVLQEHIETLKINLEAEKSMRKFYQERYDRKSDNYSISVALQNGSITLSDAIRLMQ